MRQGGVRPARDNRLKRGALEPRLPDSPIDGQSDVAFHAPAADFLEEAGRDHRQPARRLAERFGLVSVLAYPTALDETPRRHPFGLGPAPVLPRRAPPTASSRSAAAASRTS